MLFEVLPRPPSPPPTFRKTLAETRRYYAESTRQSVRLASNRTRQFSKAKAVGFAGACVILAAFVTEDLRSAAGGLAALAGVYLIVFLWHLIRAPVTRAAERDAQAQEVQWTHEQETAEIRTRLQQQIERQAFADKLDAVRQEWATLLRLQSNFGMRLSNPLSEQAVGVLGRVQTLFRDEGQRYMLASLGGFEPADFEGLDDDGIRRVMAQKMSHLEAIAHRIRAEGPRTLG